jgi:hypothetical protein
MAFGARLSLGLERGGCVQRRTLLIEQRDRNNFNKPERLVDPQLPSKAPSEFLGNDQHEPRMEAC